MDTRRALAGLLLVAIVLPIAILVLTALGVLLHALGEAGGARLVRFGALLLGGLWVFDLVGMLLLLAARALDLTDQDTFSVDRLELDEEADEVVE